RGRTRASSTSRRETGSRPAPPSKAPRSGPPIVSTRSDGGAWSGCARCIEALPLPNRSGGFGWFLTWASGEAQCGDESEQGESNQHDHRDHIRRGTERDGGDEDRAGDGRAE